MSVPMLTRIQRFDSIKLDSTYFTEEGYLIDHPIVTSVGIFEYKNADGSIRRELRLPENVFDPKSLATYQGKPVIITHDAGRVHKGNVAYESVGTILSEGIPSGSDVRAKIVIHEIDKVKRSGLRELSLGYDLVLDETPGEWEGQPYDAVQTEIRINHLALVGEARAGDQARLNIDGTTKPLGGKQMSKNTGKALSVEELIKRLDARRQRRLDSENDSIAEDASNGDRKDEERADLFTPGGSDTPAEASVSPEEKVQMIKDRRDRRDEEGSPGTHEAALDCLLQQDEDIDALLGICEELMAQRDFAAPAAEGANKDEGEEPDSGEGASLVINLDSKDKRAISNAIAREVAERTKLLRMGDRLNLDGLEDLTPIQMKAAIVKAVNPSMRLDGKGTNYINAAYDLAVDSINSEKTTDRQRRQMSYRRDSTTEYQPAGKTMADVAREKMNDRLMNGGKE